MHRLFQGQAPWINALALVAATSALAITVVALRDEINVTQAQHLLNDAVARDTPVRLLAPDLASQIRPARAALFEALAQAHVAEHTDDPILHSQRLASARALLASAAAGRPDWGLALTAHAYVDSLDGKVCGPAMIEALARSYAADGYIAPFAAWRVQASLTCWPKLDQATRQHVIEEAAWFSTRPGSAYLTIMPMIVNTPIEVPVMRLRAQMDAQAVHPQDEE